MMNALILPQWVEEALKAANKPLTTALDPVKLADTLSNEDVAIYILINHRLFGKMFPAISEGMSFYNLAPSTNQTDPYLQEKASKITKLWHDLADSYKDAPPAYLVNSHLPYQPDPTKNDGFVLGNDVGDYGFDIEFVENVLFLKPFILETVTPWFEQKITCYDKLINFLTIHQPFEAVAKSGIFKEYLRMLKTRNA